MKQLLLVGSLALVLSTVSLSGCAPGRNTAGATATGAGLGALIGGSLGRGRGRWGGAVAGAVVGSILGNQVGRYMDRQDRANMKNAIANVPIGQRAEWTNSKGVAYSVQPVRVVHRNNRYCREYITKVKINGNWRKAYGRACRRPDGSWKIVK